MPPPIPPPAAAAASAAGESIWKIGAAGRAAAEAAAKAGPPPRRFTPGPYTNHGVRPESPAFIAIPRPEQAPRDPPPKLKGFIPRPRNLFPASKANKDIEAATIPRQRARQPAPDTEAYAQQQWKLVMAQKRSEHLKEGMSSLLKKKAEKEKWRKESMEKRARERAELLEAAEREDVRLTLPSVLDELRAEKGVLPDPNRNERLVAMKERREQIVEKKKEERQDAINKLYNVAGGFVLTEAQLDDAIGSIFVEDDLDVMIRRGPRMPRISDMLFATAKYESRTTPVFGGGTRNIEDVGGALTGGKLPSVPEM